MTPDIMAWGKGAIEDYDIDTAGRTIEFGSRNINGSFRGYFTGPYVGVDMFEGPGVDVVMRIADLGPHNGFWGNDFDTVVCTELIEHDLEFWKTLDQAWRVLNSGGFFLLTTCGFGAAVHEYPSDYYRFSSDAINDLLELWGFQVVEVREITGLWHTIAAVGKK